MTHFVTTEVLSKALVMHRTYLCKLFSEETGLTANQYVPQVKMKEANRLIDVTSSPQKGMAHAPRRIKTPHVKTKQVK